MTDLQCLATPIQECCCLVRRRSMVHFATLLGAVALNWVPGIDFTIQQAAANCDYWWCGWSNSHLPARVAVRRSELLGAIAVGSILVYGSRTSVAAAGYALIDDQKKNDKFA